MISVRIVWVRLVRRISRNECCPAFTDSWREHIRAVSTVLRLERAGGGPRSWAGALPIRLVLVSRLRLRQARDLWVFNRNELKTKGLPDGKNRDKNDVRLGV